jgi:DNA-binding CsgD family transcriptional regulator
MMAETWRLILLLVPLIAGAISIFFSFRLMKRFRIPFAGSFFYYMVFLYIFGTYSIAGAGILEYLLIRMEVDQKVIHSARLYAVFLGIPFLALAKFMFLRSILDFFQRKTAGFFIAIYFLILLAAFVIFGVYMVRLTRFELGDYQTMIDVQRWVYIAFMIILYLSAFIYIFLLSAKLSNIPAKKYIRIFAFWYLAFMVLCTGSLALTSYHPLFRQLFLLFFLSWHLIPLLFMNIYLNKHQVSDSDLQEDFESRLLTFASEHEISKRECDVVRLICGGLSNQEISDTLFISLQTVKDHTHRIFVKTGVRNRVQLTNMIR